MHPVGLLMAGVNLQASVMHVLCQEDKDNIPVHISMDANSS